MLELIEQVDAFRRPERLDRLILACEADARGRGPELRLAPYPQAAMLRAAQGAASAVRLSPDVLAGTDGAVIAERLRTARIAAIGNVARSQSSGS